MNMNKKAIRVSALVIMILLVSLSCKKEPRNDDTAIADVYVRSILSGGVPVYGLSQYVWGHAPITKVIVTNPDGTTNKLLANGPMMFLNEYVLYETYSATLPMPGTYIFNITFDDGVLKVVTNELGPDFLPPATITSIAKSADGRSVNMSWQELPGVDSLRVIIEGIVYPEFDTGEFAPISGNTINIPLYPGWTYDYTLTATKYESGKTGLLQSVSIASGSFTF
jgi:hypothetical protein